MLRMRSVPSTAVPMKSTAAATASTVTVPRSLSLSVSEASGVSGAGEGVGSALDVALLFVLLPRNGLGGYVFTFIAAHLVNFALSLRRLLRVTGLRASASAAVRTALLAVGAGAAALLTPAPGPEAAELLLRGAIYAGTYGLAACVSGTAELCVPESLRPARRAEKARALR